jgi:molybdate/tungstate transport system ATP-binding protein
MIRLEGVSIRFPGFTLVDINLRVAEGEFFALIGPTGAGKTLILESLAGLIKPSSGRIWIKGKEVTRLPPERRAVGIVYQDHALFPHLSVRKNITYGLRYLKQERREQEKTAGELAQRLGIAHLQDRSIGNLSGGEKQRVALARALAAKPKVLLLDEPLSALDPNFRQDLREMLASLHRETGLTCLMVTHDFSEVLTLAQRAAVINQGAIEQVGTVSQIFQRPQTRFVAEFVGMKNLFPAEFRGGAASLGELKLRVADSALKGPGYICVRPEKVRLLDGSVKGGQNDNVFSAQVKALADLGSHWEAKLQAHDLTLHCILPGAGSQNLVVGREAALVQIRPEDIHCIAAGAGAFERPV